MVKRMNLKELKEILSNYRDEDLKRIAIALPCGTDDGSDGGAKGLGLIFTLGDELGDKMFDLFDTKGFKKIQKHLVDKLNYDFDFRDKLMNEKADDEDYKDFECGW